MPPPPPVVQAQVIDPQQQAANILAAINLERQRIEESLIRLGMSEVSSREFTSNGMYILGLPYHIKQVNKALANTWNEALKSESEARNLPSDIIKSPDPFKKETKWCQWKESVCTYLNSKIGQGGIPLAYILRENDVPQNQVSYRTFYKQLII